jgi:hypothetical protein
MAIVTVYEGPCIGIVMVQERGPFLVIVMA